MVVVEVKHPREPKQIRKVEPEKIKIFNFFGNSAVYTPSTGECED